MAKQHLIEPLQNTLLKIVKKESDMEWAKTPTVMPKKKIHKCENIKWEVGWYNFIKNVLNEIKP
jgi:hypothetical protein